MKKCVIMILCFIIFLTACRASAPEIETFSTFQTETTSPTETNSVPEVPDLVQQYKTFAEELVVDALKETFYQHVQDPALREAFPYLPSMYTYESSAGRIVYLFGTSQAYCADTPWFPKYAQAALDESSALVTAHPEIDYSDEDLAYAAKLMAQESQETTEATAKFMQAIESNRENLEIYINAPAATQVRLLYWFFTRRCELAEKQMNDAIWNMAEGKERILAYTGTDVINRMNSLDTEMDTILIASSGGKIFNSEAATIGSIYQYYYWLESSCYSNTYSDNWWDNRFFCDAYWEHAEAIAELSGIPAVESCNGFLCAPTHYAEFYKEYNAAVFMPNCQDIADAIETTEADSVFVAVDLVYISDLINILESRGWTLVERQPF